MTVKGHERPLLLPWKAGEGAREVFLPLGFSCVERGQFGSFVVTVVVLVFI